MINHARSFVAARTPWRHRGRKPWGLDCIGLIVVSAKAGGLPAEDFGRYGREPWEDTLRRELRRQAGEPIWTVEQSSPVEGVKDWLPGDVALVQWDRRGPTHVGLIADYVHGGLSLIHCENINGCIEHALSGFRLDCIIEVYRPWPVKSSL